MMELVDIVKTYGPYKGKDNRSRIVKNGKTVSYPREVWKKANGKIPEEYEVHHKDNNPDNNDIDNLELKSKIEHRKLHRPTLEEEFLCLCCGCEFVLRGNRLSNHKSNRKKGKTGPFCSRSCAGKWSAE